MLLFHLLNNVAISQRKALLFLLSQGNLEKYYVSRLLGVHITC